MKKNLNSNGLTKYYFNFFFIYCFLLFLFAFLKAKVFWRFSLTNFYTYAFVWITLAFCFNLYFFLRISFKKPVILKNQLFQFLGSIILANVWFWSLAVPVSLFYLFLGGRPWHNSAYAKRLCAHQSTSCCLIFT